MGKHYSAKSCLGLILSLVAFAACAQGSDDPVGDDTGDVCGDGSCTGAETETSCAADCDGAGCGDGTCNNGETSATCPQDCGANAVCGDGTCQAGENAASCSQDCGTQAVCGDGICNGTENNTTCAGDCPAQAVCGDGTCQATENATSCAADCSATTGCGDGVCNPAAGECESADILCLFECAFDPNNPCAAPAPAPSCDHDACTIGGPLMTSCSQCAADVCAIDDWCCTEEWDDLCVQATVDAGCTPAC